MMPTLRAVARELDTLNRDFDGPGPVTLWFRTASNRVFQWEITQPFEAPTLIIAGAPQWQHVDHIEHIPGDAAKFDAVAAARRLLAELPKVP